MQRLEPWHGHCELTFSHNGRNSVHQGGCSAPFKLLRANLGDDGRCEIPLLHTAGGLVGGDRLSIDLNLEPSSKSLITSVAAQKIYGSVGRSQLHPNGTWAQQRVNGRLAADSDLEWLPQELVVYADALFEQQLTVQLPENASFLSIEIVRLGRTAAGETLNKGCWHSSVAVQRTGPGESRWELVDRLALDDNSLMSSHGLDGAPVCGTLVWAAPMPLDRADAVDLLAGTRSDREGLNGAMHCSSLHQGLVARYRGSSSRDARFWFSRIWARTRALRGLAIPSIPRVWPLQEQPFARQTFTANPAALASETD